MTHVLNFLTIRSSAVMEADSIVPQRLSACIQRLSLPESQRGKRHNHLALLTERN
jgi:hypothetical protein